MSNDVKRIVIVGGGTAGWFAAAYLDKTFNTGTAVPLKPIIVIESPDIPIIGVGESTIPSIVKAMANLGLDERELMRETAATFKNAIKFVNWRQSPEIEPNNSFYHPFGTAGHIGATPSLFYWMAWKPEGRKPRFDYATGPGAIFSDRLRIPKLPNYKSFEGSSPYSYHIDAVLLGRYLRKICLSRGVTRIEDSVRHALLDNNGNIAAVQTLNNGPIEGDLFIDCTGFAQVLIGQLEKDNFESYADTLLCDAALAVQIPFGADKKDRPNSFTTATAQRSGWIWDIHLQARRGIGYVYSTAHTTDAEAERDLRRYIGPGVTIPPIRKIPMKLGRNKVFWSRNCVAVGLSAGFVEPLESTGIFTIEAGLLLLRQNFPDRTFPAVLSRQYNTMMAHTFDEIRDFIALHYCLSSREDSRFWLDNKRSIKLSGQMRENLELWKHRPPLDSDLTAQLKPYAAPAYSQILAGMNKLPERLPDFVRRNSEKDLHRIDSFFRKIHQETSKKLANSMEQAEYLRSLVA